MCQHGIFQ
ncbi:hypothetical protein E2C01_064473 [Portunus trituberculatus]|uniref:Uncharacterized protein n=1 Tax=Portunus trituberculatus TaxID=210409 RepID=A0A5B7HBY4_PORTR|nr:hypothetical protein [Portunus trituberculatus]